jgi:hypothetical protein
MDTAQSDRAGITPIQPTLSKIAGVKTNADAFRVMADLNKEGGAAGFFGLNGGPDIKNTQINIAQAAQGGLGLPDQAFYFRKDSAAAAIREAYQSHISRMFQLLGDAPASADTQAAHIFALESALAKVSMSRISRRDPNANYHKMSLADANAITPHLEWRAFILQSHGLDRRPHASRRHQVLLALARDPRRGAPAHHRLPQGGVPLLDRALRRVGPAAPVESVPPGRELRAPRRRHAGVHRESLLPRGTATGTRHGRQPDRRAR